MCGINGVWSKTSQIDISKFNTMRDTLSHRGPDGAGTWFNPDKSIALGHRRLAFMDLGESGKQPMLSQDNNICITVNGEIYNYPELKKSLQDKGHKFQSDSDSEIIIHAWQEWKTDLLSKLNGMFAFALYDNTTNELLLARDRFGIKPLYYHNDTNTILFGSEIKAIISYKPELKIINKQSVANFFSYRYIPSPGTIYQNINKLEPASFILFQDGKIKIAKKYWDFPKGKVAYKQKELTKTIKEYFKKSVQIHTQSQVPVGSFLSGGYDSSAIVQMLKENNYPANTFSIGFNNWDGSEDKYAKLVADHFQMKHFSKKAEDANLDLLEKLMFYYDEPIADISIIPTYLVSQLAVKHNKAVLSGEGADEIFSGYTWHYENIQEARFISRFKNIFLSNHKPKAFSIEAYSHAMAMGHLRKDELKELLNKDYHSSIPEDSDWFYRKSASNTLDLNRFRKLDLRCFMSELVLTKIDRASMANSLEVRVPFLENNLTDLLLQTPQKYIYRKGYKKFQLYQIIKDYQPKEILKRKKQGFVGPDIYYQNPDWYKNIIDNSVTCDKNIINKETLYKLLDNKEYWKLWKFTVFETWYKKWM